MKKTNRQIIREAQQKKQARSRALIFGVSIVAILIVIAVVLLSANNSPVSARPIGDVVAISSSDHVPNNTVPGPYNSNPPAGGTHFETSYSARFYQEADLASLPQNPQGYLVHSLEHGYVIFWYNCQAANTDCSALKQTIQKVMDETGGTKLIAFPWADMDVPLAMTSWGRILKFPTADPVLMKRFVERNRYQAPEPNGV